MIAVVIDFIFPRNGLLLSAIKTNLRHGRVSYFLKSPVLTMYKSNPPLPSGLSEENIINL